MAGWRLLGLPLPIEVMVCIDLSVCRVTRKVEANGAVGRAVLKTIQNIIRRARAVEKSLRNIPVWDNDNR